MVFLHNGQLTDSEFVIYILKQLNKNVTRQAWIPFLIWWDVYVLENICWESCMCTCRVTCVKVTYS